MLEFELLAKLSELESENAALRLQVGRVGVLESENSALRERVNFLEQSFSVLTKRVEQMLVSKNSGNSSMPPSSDLVRKTKSLRKSSGLRPGGQLGHRGATLKMTDKPDHIQALVPDFCGKCADVLDKSKAVLAERRQVADIPPIHVEVTEFQAFGIVCGCGHHQVADFPPGVDNHTQYGPHVCALTVYHSVYQYMPFKRLQHFFAHICHLPLSMGTLENIVARTANKARPIWDGFRQALEQSKSVGSDETGAKVNGKNQWIWVWQNAVLTFIAVAASRGSILINALFPHGFPLATLCSDRWKAQLKTGAKNHQLCLPHLLRELEYLIQTEKTTWANQFKELLQKSIKLKQNQAHYPKQDPKTMEIEQELDRLLREIVPDKNAKKTTTFFKSINKYRNYLFPFLYDPLVPFDNNASERSIRNVKVKLKVSGQFKTGQEFYCILRSIIDTTIKNGQSVFDAIAAIYLLPNPPKAAV